MEYGTRGQSETVGVILLTAVIVVLSSVVGATILSNFNADDRTQPTVDIKTQIIEDEDGESHLIVEHQGGDSFDRHDIFFVFQGDFEGRFELSDDQFTLKSGSSETLFAPGDRWSGHLDGLEGSFRVLVFDDDSGQLLHEDSHATG